MFSKMKAHVDPLRPLKGEIVLVHIKFPLECSSMVIRKSASRLRGSLAPHFLHIVSIFEVIYVFLMHALTEPPNMSVKQVTGNKENVRLKKWSQSNSNPLSLLKMAALVAGKSHSRQWR
jgi:hypothetical protein